MTTIFAIITKRTTSLTLNIYLICSFLLAQIRAADLSNLYVNDVNLTVVDSPYMVVSNIEIRSTSTIYVEDGTEIIFTGDHTITIYGTFDVGCYELDISSTDTRGLSNNAAYTHFHGHQNFSRIGTILIETFNAAFCNAKFSNMNVALSSITTSSYQVDNCEFDDLNYAFYDDTAYVDTITNSYIHNVAYVTYKYGFIYDNNLIEDFTSFYSYTNGLYKIAIRNTEIIGPGSGTCIKINSYTGSADQVLYNNNISSCSAGIWMDSSSLEGITIEGNTIKDCVIGIWNLEPANIHYINNVFINNTERGIYAKADYSEHTATVIGNRFINNDNTNGWVLLYMSKIYNVIIEDNVFEGNNFDYGMWIDFDSYRTSSVNYSIKNNIFIDNTFQTELIYLKYISYIDIENNVFDNNIIFGKLIRLFDIGQVINVLNNLFINNQIKDSATALYYHDCRTNYCTETNFKYNNLTNNQLASSASSNLLYFRNAQSNYIQYNQFMNNILPNNYSTNNIIYSYNSNKDIIQYNNFYEEEHIHSIIYEYDYVSSAFKIQYNNFLSYDNALYVITLDDNADLRYADLNYLGGYSDIDNISHKMYDVCDSLNTGLITFWPWYQIPIDFEDLNNLPPECTWNVVDCSYSGSGWCITKEPTTAAPTPQTDHPTSVTDSPSRNPTDIPTTAIPTFSPTSAQPTYTPSTHSPTAPTTLYPSTSPTTSEPSITTSLSELSSSFEKTVISLDVADGSLSKHCKMFRVLFVVVYTFICLFC